MYVMLVCELELELCWMTNIDGGIFGDDRGEGGGAFGLDCTNSSGNPFIQIYF